jgi:hypothetical protein
MARGTRRCGDLGHCLEKCSAHTADERDVERVRQTPIGMAVQHDAIAEPSLEAIPEEVSQPLHLGYETQVLCSHASLAEGACQQGALRTGAPSHLVARAVDQGFQVRSGADVQRANALWRVDLVTSEGEEIDAELVHVRCDFTSRLSGVGVEERAVLTGDPRARFNRFDRPGLVVRMHDANEKGIAADRATKIIWIDETGAIHWQVCDASAQALEERAGREDRELKRTLAALAEGERRAVYRTLWPLLVRFIAAASRDRALAEEIAQRAMLRILSKVATFDPSRDALAWSLAIALNEYRSYRRRRAHAGCEPEESDRRSGTFWPRFGQRTGRRSSRPSARARARR